MAKRILQVNFKFPENMDPDSPEAQQSLKEWVQHAAEFPGLTWKIWLRNEETGKAGGIYLFEDEQALEKYRTGKSIRQINEMMLEVSINSFGIEEEPTRMTCGPVG